MRLYLKLALMIAVFACAASREARQITSELAYEARVKFVCTFGSAADYEALVDDTQRMLAAEQGNLDLYRTGKRYRQLLAERRAAAARLNTSLTDEDLQRIAAEVFGQSKQALALGDGRDDGAASAP